MPEYVRQTWIDRIVADDTGEVLQNGTIVNAARMNHIEEGIEQTNASVETLLGGTTGITFQTLQQEMNSLSNSVDGVMGLANTVNNHEDRINSLEINWENSDVSNKVDKVPGKGLSANDYTDTDKAKVQSLPENPGDVLSGKVDKITGKGLSTYDFNAEYKNKVDGCASQSALNTLIARVTELETWKTNVMAGTTGIGVEQEETE